MKKILILLMFFYATNAFAFLRAKTSEVSISETDVFQLEIQTDANIQDMPDLTALQTDFEIVGQGTSQSYQFDGRNHISRNSLNLNLIPKRTGILTIPSITWGKEKTDPLQIEVKQTADTVQMQNENAVIIEAQLLSNEVYQGAGLIYRAKVFERIGLINGDFEPPYLQNAEILALGPYTLSQEQKDGSLYQVLTQDYAIFPQDAGKNLTIEPAKFQGYYRKMRSTEQLLPFGLSDSFIYQPRTSVRKEVSVCAKPVQITVLPQPANTKNHWWLPANNVSLTEDWNVSPEIKVGDSITRQIELSANGASNRMLPDLHFTNNDDFKVYPEEAKKNQIYDKDSGLIAYETQNFAFIPLHAGQVTLPALSVYWFDVNDGQIKMTTLPSKTFTVKPNPQYASTVQKKKDKTSAQQETPAPISQQEPFRKENNLLYFIGGLCFGLIFGIFGIILLHQKHAHKKKLPELYPHEK